MKFFNSIVHTGIDETTPPSRVDEVKLMNSLSFHSIILSFSMALAVYFLLPEHRLIATTIAMSEAIAKLCVILLNNLHKYLVSKIIFSFITMTLFVIVVMCFGFDTNFHYMGLTVMFGLAFIFRTGKAEDTVLFTSYLVLSSVAYIYLYAAGIQYQHIR